jgi:hypothetical protein
MMRAQVRFHRTLKMVARFNMDNVTYDYVVTQGDTGPLIEFACVDQNRVALNLTGKTVEFYMRKAGEATGHKNLSVACTVTNAAGGLATYSFGVADLDETGTYLCDVVIRDTKIETAWDVLRLVVRVKNK